MTRRGHAGDAWPGVCRDLVGAGTAGAGIPAAAATVAAATAEVDAAAREAGEQLTPAERTARINGVLVNGISGQPQP